MAICIAVFLIDYFVEMNDSVNQLNREVIIIAYSIVVVAFIWFSYQLLKQISLNLQVEIVGRYKKIVRFVLLIFAVSMFLRIAFNVAYLAWDEDLCEYEQSN